jgi:hypothetical protein
MYICNLQSTWISFHPQTTATRGQSTSGTRWIRGRSRVLIWQILGKELVTLTSNKKGFKLCWSEIFSNIHRESKNMTNVFDRLC